MQTLKESFAQCWNILRKFTPIHENAISYIEEKYFENNRKLIPLFPEDGRLVITPDNASLKQELYEYTKIFCPQIYNSGFLLAVTEEDIRTNRVGAKSPLLRWIGKNKKDKKLTSVISDIIFTATNCYDYEKDGFIGELHKWQHANSTWYISINPLDILTMSENACFESCHCITPKEDGSFSLKCMGSIEYLITGNVLIIYKSNLEKLFYGASLPYKLCRVLCYLNKDIMFFGRQYPTHFMVPKHVVANLLKIAECVDIKGAEYVQTSFDIQLETVAAHQEYISNFCIIKSKETQLHNNYCRFRGASVPCLKCGEIIIGPIVGHSFWCRECEEKKLTIEPFYCYMCYLYIEEEEIDWIIDKCMVAKPVCIHHSHEYTQCYYCGCYIVEGGKYIYKNNLPVEACLVCYTLYQDNFRYFCEKCLFYREFDYPCPCGEQNA